MHIFQIYQWVFSGDAEPTYKGPIVLYAMKFCPFCDRVRFILDYYQVDYEIVFIDLTNKPDWYLGKMPEGKVPLLRLQDNNLVDSELIIKFINLNYGKILVEEDDQMDLAKQFWNSMFPLLYTILFKETGFTLEDVKSFEKEADELECKLMGPYLFGDKLSIADVYLYPILNRWECIMGRASGMDSDKICDNSPQCRPCCTLGDGTTRWPKLMAYKDAVRGLDCIRENRVSTTLMARFNETRQQGHPEYDMC
ncbi:Glutathione S-transferase omega-1 [Cichlidogyrus casuarinus]|uniref:Glutathione S-transferase omega-1 n=1 Tax=Cichlidogyrus casuarinus TaxID=1844966 RepID=A0ABD2PZP3_9PLAT